MVQRFDEARQGGGVVVEEAMGADNGSEAVGQSGDGQGVDAGGQRIAHAQVLQDELAVAQLQSGLQRGCKECMPSFYAPTCVKNLGFLTVPRLPTEGLPAPAGLWRLWVGASVLSQ